VRSHGSTLHYAFARVRSPEGVVRFSSFASVLIKKRSRSAIAKGRGQYTVHQEVIHLPDWALLGCVVEHLLDYGVCVLRTIRDDVVHWDSRPVVYLGEVCLELLSQTIQFSA
jgi:hypothetical protein